MIRLAIIDLTGWLKAAGFTGIDIAVKPENRDPIREWAPGLGIESYSVSSRSVPRQAVTISSRDGFRSGC